MSCSPACTATACRRHAESDYAVLFWLRDLLKPGTHVFDFGGHVGVSWYG